MQDATLINKCVLEVFSGRFGITANGNPAIHFQALSDSFFPSSWNSTSSETTPITQFLQPLVDEMLSLFKLYPPYPHIRDNGADKVAPYQLDWSS